MLLTGDATPEPKRKENNSPLWVVCISLRQCHGTDREPNLSESNLESGWYSYRVLNWPCIGYFYEDALANHWEELVALGNIDNEPLNLETTWYDKLVKLRELILNHLKPRSN